MRVVIRTDSSEQIGSGHLMRCLTLAAMLREEGADVTFVCRNLPGNFSSNVIEKGFPLHLLDSPVSSDHSSKNRGFDKYRSWLGERKEEDARQTIAHLESQGTCDWLVVDHYAIDYQWETAIRPFTGRIMVIDDIANRRHDCDILLDQNLYNNPESRHAGLVPNHCRMFLGPKYALLRKEFYEARKTVKLRNGKINRVFVFFGGSDITNETTKTLRAISRLSLNDTHIDVVIGDANRAKADIESLVSTMPNAQTHYHVENMAELMSRADIAIGGGGTTTWERCFLGLPTLTIIVAENQRDMIETAAERGVLWNLGWHSDVSENDVIDFLKSLFGSPARIQHVGDRAARLLPQVYSAESHPVVAEILDSDNAIQTLDACENRDAKREREVSL